MRASTYTVRSSLHPNAGDVSPSFMAALRRLLRGTGIVAPVASADAGGADLPIDEPAVRPAIGRVQVFVEEHAGERLSLERLADEAGLSTYHFARVFREEVGTTPWSYVRAARLRRVKTLLEETDRSLAAIAFDCGFCDQSHLTRAFKRDEGVTPGTYRKNLQECGGEAA